jgi:hypothetical protein
MRPSSTVVPLGYRLAQRAMRSRLKFEVLRRELHKVQSELARLKVLHARDQCEREERMHMIIVAALSSVEMGFCIEKRTN